MRQIIEQFEALTRRFALMVALSSGFDRRPRRN